MRNDRQRAASMGKCAGRERPKGASGRMNFTRERDRDFIRACSAVMERYRRLGRSVTERRIVEEALRSGAPFYYISLDHSLERVSKLLKDSSYGDRSIRCTARREMWSEITGKVAVELNRGRSTLTQCVAKVLERGSASRFSISLPYGIKIFRNHFKRQVGYEAV